MGLYKKSAKVLCARVQGSLNIFNLSIIRIIYLKGTLGFQHSAAAATNTADVVATTTAATSSRLNSFNKGLIRKLFEPSAALTTTTTTTTMGGHGHHHPHNQRCSRISNLATMSNSNDLFSSFAYSEHLQSKMEKFLAHVCLKKSNTFSKTTNFSYVDYTKRQIDF